MIKDNLFIILIIGMGVILLVLFFIMYLFKRKDIVNDEEEIELYAYDNPLRGDFINKKYYGYKDVPLYRDLPFNNDYFTACYISTQYGIGVGGQNTIKVVLLKWIKDNNIEMVTNNNKIEKIILKNPPEDNEELKMFKMMKEASNDNILDSDEFAFYCKENHLKVKDWISSVLTNKYGELLNNHELITINYNKENKLKPHYEFIATEELNNKALQLAGLKKFFHEMTLMHEKEPIDVKLWRDYLIYAQIFDMSYEVSKVFNEFYNIQTNEFVEIHLLNTFLDNTVYKIINNVEISQKIEESLSTHMSFSNSNISKAKDYSFGGGGFSSGGGGGGSFGGGGGGSGSR